jgi:tetratricopeptide (TPR) repeat protein
LVAPVLVAAAALASSPGCQWASVGQNADGVRMFQQGYYQGALERFQQAVRSNPNGADGYYNLAATHHRLAKLHSQDADYQRAEAYYHQCLDHSQFNHAECYRGLAVLLVERGRSQEALTLLEDWARRNPLSPTPQIELARLFQETGNRDAAKQRLIEALATDPNNARALTALAKLREDAGETRQALANYQRSLEINRFQPQVAARIASLQSALSPAPPAANGNRTVSTPAPAIR